MKARLADKNCMHLMSVSALNGSIPARMLEVWLRKHVRVLAGEWNHRNEQARPSNRHYRDKKRHQGCNQAGSQGQHR